MAIHATCLLPLLAAAGEAPPPLPSLTLGEVSTSGLSSGADFVVQMQVAYSDLVHGTGVYAGQAYHCAETYFPGEPLLEAADPSVPFCDGCPRNTTITYDHCKKASLAPLIGKNLSALMQYTRRQAAAGTIAPLETLGTRRVFLYRGLNDTTYNKGAVQATTDVFRHFLPAESVRFEKKIQSAHLVPTIDPYLCWWEEWAGPDNCTFDGAYNTLSWVHGEEALAGGRSNNTEELYTKYLTDFDQKMYFPKSGRDPLMEHKAKVFVPPSCATKGAKCNAHFFFHGCGVTFSYEVFTQFSGYNEWAFKNNFVVVYPKMSTKGKIKQMHSGCFDGYGDTGKDYALRSGPQMETVANMMRAMRGSGTAAVGGL